MISIGDQAPALELVDHTGEPWRLADHSGRDVVLIFHRHFY